MKALLVSVVACFVVSTTLYSQPVTSNKDEIVEVLAIQLSEEIAEAYWQKQPIEMPLYSVDKEGILRPRKGYKLGINLEKRVYLVASVDSKFPTRDELIANYDEEPIPGGTMYCMCGGSNDDCKISVNIVDNRLHYFCDGSCDCHSFSESDGIDIDTKVITIMGAWDTFSNISKH